FSLCLLNSLCFAGGEFKALGNSIQELNKAMETAAMNPMDDWRRAAVKKAYLKVPSAVSGMAQVYFSGQLGDRHFPMMQGILGNMVDLEAPEKYYQYTRKPGAEIEFERSGSGTGETGSSHQGFRFNNEKGSTSSNNSANKQLPNAVSKGNVVLQNEHILDDASVSSIPSLREEVSSVPSSQPMQTSAEQAQELKTLPQPSNEAGQWLGKTQNTSPDAFETEVARDLADIESSQSSSYTNDHSPLSEDFFKKLQQGDPNNRKKNKNLKKSGKRSDLWQKVWRFVKNTILIPDAYAEPEGREEGQGSGQILSALSTMLMAAAMAGAQVGVAAINADAQKYGDRLAAEAQAQATEAQLASNLKSLETQKELTQQSLAANRENAERARQSNENIHRQEIAYMTQKNSSDLSMMMLQMQQTAQQQQNLIALTRETERAKTEVALKTAEAQANATLAQAGIKVGLPAANSGTSIPTGSLAVKQIGQNYSSSSAPARSGSVPASQMPGSPVTVASTAAPGAPAAPTGGSTPVPASGRAALMDPHKHLLAFALEPSAPSIGSSDSAKFGFASSNSVSVARSQATQPTSMIQSPMSQVGRALFKALMQNCEASGSEENRRCVVQPQAPKTDLERFRKDLDLAARTNSQSYAESLATRYITPPRKPYSEQHARTLLPTNNAQVRGHEHTQH
ncbi:MAG: hypothetical protein HY537_13485, partial [Deltaproteobacteria bacterium]|nr:hypothetical protein [Deltaproteobacteria bacterium]